jgi:hypothetical protein
MSRGLRPNGQNFGADRNIHVYGPQASEQIPRHFENRYDPSQQLEQCLITKVGNVGDGLNTVIVGEDKSSRGVGMKMVSIGYEAWFDRKSFVKIVIPFPWKPHRRVSEFNSQNVHKSLSVRYLPIFFCNSSESVLRLGLICSQCKVDQPLLFSQLQ